jgi:hypothetical protein
MMVQVLGFRKQGIDGGRGLAEEPLTSGGVFPRGKSPDD